MAILRAENLAKIYKKRSIVSNVSYEVSSGEVVGLLGPNGAGKTTSFYMMVGLVPSDAGHITLDERNITPLAMHARARLGIGYLPQEASIFRKLTVEQNIMGILQLRKKLNKKQRRDELEQLLEDFQITHIRHSEGMALSGGERRRVEIARALAAEPKFILLDEPFAGVDPISVNDIQHIITNLTQRDIGVLITDHNVRETLSICKRAYILNNGHVIAAGRPNEVLNNTKVREVYLGEDFKL